MNRLVSALQCKNSSRPPVWFMRQAGRYHSHYQGLRRRHSFVDLCKKPELACEVTLGPMRDFGFDAAILFSDLLFPLEALGMGLSYDPAPTLAWHLEREADAEKLRSEGAGLASELRFQAEALKLIRASLAPELGLLGFVGGPLTLFCYAVDGSHSGGLESSRKGLGDGRFDAFNAKLLGLLAENMVLQANAGADAVAIFDTCAGEFPPEVFEARAVPALKALLDLFHRSRPGFPVVYYSRGTSRRHFEALSGLSISCLGVDWRNDLGGLLAENAGRRAIQGNVDPEWLLLEAAELERRLRAFFAPLAALAPGARAGWVCGLGHGVLPGTPEGNVRLFVRIQHEIFGGAS